MKLTITSCMPASMILGLCMVIFSCSDTTEKFTGNLKLSLELSYTVTDKSGDAGGGPVTYAPVADLKIEIYEKDGASPVKSYENYSDVPEVITLPEGDYYVTAFSKENLAAAFEKPYFYGKSSDFRILDGETTTVSVVCTLDNIMVTIVYSDKVQTSFTDYETTVANDRGSLLFVKNETRAGYFDAGPLDISVTLDYVEDGQNRTKTLSGMLSAQKGKHYTVTVNANPGELISGAGIDVSIDDNVSVVNVELNDNGITSEAGAGRLLITEIMYNPKELPDASGEWIEVYNNTDEPFNMKGLVVKRGTGGFSHKIAADVIISPGGYAVLAKSIDATDNVDYVVSSMNLVNDGMEIIITTDGADGELICSVDYSLEGFNKNLDGKSLQLDPSVKDAESARLGSNWCAATVVYSTGDMGTPGAANTPCN